MATQNNLILLSDKFVTNNTIEVDNTHDSINTNYKHTTDQEDTIFDNTQINDVSLCNLLKKNLYFKNSTFNSNDANKHNIPTFGNSCYIWDSHFGACLKGINNYLDSASTPSLISFLEETINFYKLPKQIYIKKQNSGSIFLYNKLYDSEHFNYDSQGNCLHLFDWSAFSNYDILIFVYVIQKIERITLDESFKIFHHIMDQYNIQSTAGGNIVKKNIFNLITTVITNYLWQYNLSYCKKNIDPNINSWDTIIELLRNITFIKMNIQQSKEYTTMKYKLYKSDYVKPLTTSSLFNQSDEIEKYINYYANKSYEKFKEPSSSYNKNQSTTEYIFTTSQPMTAHQIIHNLQSTETNKKNNIEARTENQQSSSESISMIDGIQTLLQKFPNNTSEQRQLIWRMLKFQGDSNHMSIYEIINKAYDEIVTKGNWCLQNNRKFDKSTTNIFPLKIIILTGERPLCARAMIEEKSIRVRGFNKFKDCNSNLFNDGKQFNEYISDSCIELINLKTKINLYNKTDIFDNTLINKNKNNDNEIYKKLENNFIEYKDKNQISESIESINTLIFSNDICKPFKTMEAYKKIKEFIQYFELTKELINIIYNIKLIDSKNDVENINKIIKIYTQSQSLYNDNDDKSNNLNKVILTNQSNWSESLNNACNQGKLKEIDIKTIEFITNTNYNESLNNIIKLFELCNSIEIFIKNNWFSNVRGLLEEIKEEITSLNIDIQKLSEIYDENNIFYKFNTRAWGYSPFFINKPHYTKDNPACNYQCAPLHRTLIEDIEYPNNQKKDIIEDSKYNNFKLSLHSFFHDRLNKNIYNRKYKDIWNNLEKLSIIITEYIKQTKKTEFNLSSKTDNSKEKYKSNEKKYIFLKLIYEFIISIKEQKQKNFIEIIEKINDLMIDDKEILEKLKISGLDKNNKVDEPRFKDFVDKIIYIDFYDIKNKEITINSNTNIKTKIDNTFKIDNTLSSVFLKYINNSNNNIQSGGAPFADSNMNINNLFSQFKSTYDKLRSGYDSAKSGFDTAKSGFEYLQDGIQKAKEMGLVQDKDFPQINNQFLKSFLDNKDNNFLNNNFKNIYNYLSSNTKDNLFKTIENNDNMATNIIQVINDSLSKTNIDDKIKSEFVSFMNGHKEKITSKMIESLTPNMNLNQLNKLYDKLNFFPIDYCKDDYEFIFENNIIDYNTLDFIIDQIKNENNIENIINENLTIFRSVFNSNKSNDENYTSINNLIHYYNNYYSYNEEDFIEFIEVLSITVKDKIKSKLVEIKINIDIYFDNYNHDKYIEFFGNYPQYIINEDNELVDIPNYNISIEDNIETVLQDNTPIIKNIQHPITIPLFIYDIYIHSLKDCLHQYTYEELKTKSFKEFIPINNIISTENNPYENGEQYNANNNNSKTKNKKTETNNNYLYTFDNGTCTCNLNKNLYGGANEQEENEGNNIYLYTFNNGICKCNLSGSSTNFRVGNNPRNINDYHIFDIYNYDINGKKYNTLKKYLNINTNKDIKNLLLLDTITLTDTLYIENIKQIIYNNFNTVNENSSKKSIHNLFQKNINNIVQ